MYLDKRISLIIPCKNEERAIAAMLKKVPDCVDEILVVDNNSSDKTREIAESHGARVFLEKRHVDGIGYGYAHQKGIKMATGDYIIAMDGDNTYPLKDIPKVIKKMIRENLDFVSCNRFPLHNSKAISKLRQLGVWILNIEVQLLYLHTMNDILSGMWAMKREVGPKLKLSSGGWDLSPEIKLAALSHPTIKFDEFHIHHTYRLDGDSKQSIWKTGFGHLWYILQRRITTDNFAFIAIRELFKSVKLNFKLAYSN